MHSEAYLCYRHRGKRQQHSHNLGLRGYVEKRQTRHGSRNLTVLYSRIDSALQT